MGAYRRGFEPPSAPGYRGCVRVCVCGGVRPRYGAFREYSGSLVCVESSQRERLEILHDSSVLLGVLKKRLELVGDM